MIDSIKSAWTSRTAGRRVTAGKIGTRDSRIWQRWRAPQNGRPQGTNGSLRDGWTDRGGGRTGRDDLAGRGGHPRPMRGGWPGGDDTSEQGPWPADLPSSGEAGLTAEGYGVSAEGELTEAEFARSWFEPAPPTREPHAQPPVSGPTKPGRTRPIDPTATGPADPTAVADQVAAPGLVRSSAVMALGTLASRVTGMLRTIVLVPALGAYALANAYNVANTLPNTVYNLAIGRILTSVIFTLLVSASKRYT